jgi:heme-degrading monooxygenase HmoA
MPDLASPDPDLQTPVHGQPVLAFINVLTTQPDQQAELVARITAAAELMRRLPGFLHAAIHRGLDGRRAVIYARWESVAAFAAVRKDPELATALAGIGALAQLDPVVCEVASVIHGPAAGAPWVF